MKDPNPNRWLFAFQAKGIQSFVFGSDRLRDFVGADELVRALSGNAIDKTLEKIGLEPVFLSKGAGGARLVVHETEREKLETLARVWPMICALVAPGLRVVQSCVIPVNDGLNEAMELAENQMTLSRHHPGASLPEIIPAIQRAPRTGEPVVAWDYGINEPTDRFARAKRIIREQHRNTGLPRICKEFEFPDDDAVPKETSDLAREGNRDYVALIHIDANGIGALWKQVSTSHPSANEVQFIQRFGSGIQIAARQATKEAVVSIRERIESLRPWPMLPLILAGDEVTVLIRADLALPFTRAWLDSFEKHAAGFVNDLEIGQPAITACASLVLIKPTYPFASAYRLGESILAYTKKRFRNACRENTQPSSLITIHQIGASTSSHNYEELLAHELRSAHSAGSDRIKLTMNPYVNADTSSGEFHSISAIKSLASACANVPSSGIRSLATSLIDRGSAADKDYHRLLRFSKGGEELQTAMSAIVGTTDSLMDQNRATPLLDALLLASLESPKNETA